MTDLSDDDTDIGLRKPGMFFKDSKEFAPSCVLKNEVDVLEIPEVSIYFEDVLMGETGLDDDLAFYLLNEFIFLQLRPLHFLQSHHKICFPLKCGENLPKFPPTHLLQQLEVVDGPVGLRLEGMEVDFHFFLFEGGFKVVFLGVEGRHRLSLDYIDKNKDKLIIWDNFGI